jgi:hypothetical protein
MCYNEAVQKRALSLVGAVIVSLAAASPAAAEGFPVIGAGGGTSAFYASESYEDLMRFDLSVTAEEQDLIEEYCTPDSSVREVDYDDRTNSTTTASDDYVYVDIGPSGPRVYVNAMWNAPSLSEGEVVEIDPMVFLTCTRMAPGNLPDGFVQVKINASRVFGYMPTDADVVAGRSGIVDSRHPAVSGRCVLLECGREPRGGAQRISDVRQRSLLQPGHRCQEPRQQQCSGG